MEKINVPIECPECGREIIVELDPAKLLADNQPSTVTNYSDPLMLAPNIRGDIRPVGIPYRYEITSEQIKAFIIDTVKAFCPNAQMEIHPRYCEKKKQKPGEIHRSYASFMIAFSNHVQEGYGKDGWFERLGESSDVQFIKSIKSYIIDKWSYDKKQIDSILNSYKKLERFEDGLGMSEAFINEIRQFSIPRSIKVADSKDSWIFFMASPEKILYDFFSDPKTKKLKGNLKVTDIVPISKDIIKYIITFDPYVATTTENPHVRQILSGELKV